MIHADVADGDGRSLGEWVRLVLRRWPILVASVLIGIAAGIVVSATDPTLYEARTTLVLSPASGPLDPDNASDLPVIAATLARLADDETVSTAVQRLYSERVGSAGGGARDLEWFQDHVEARVPNGTSLVQITGRAESQDRAVTLSGVSADALIAEIGRLGSNAEQGLRVAKFGTTAELGKVSPQPLQSIILWANAALLVGIVVALTFRENRTAGWRRRLTRGADAVGDVAIAPTADRSEPGYARNDVIELDRTTAERFATLASSDPADLIQLWNSVVEPGLDGLRHRVLQAATDGGKVLGVVGSARGSLLRGVATQLAGRLALDGASAVVVDANFHPDPSGREAASDSSLVPNPPRGLGDVVDRAISLEGALVEIHLTSTSNGDSADRRSRLAILPSGNPPIDPLEALSSSAFGEVMVALTERYDHVIVVAPPARWQKESVTIAGLTDGNLLVLSNHLSLEAAIRPLLAVGLVKPAR